MLVLGESGSKDVLELSCLCELAVILRLFQKKNVIKCQLSQKWSITIPVEIFVGINKLTYNIQNNPENKTKQKTKKPELRIYNT